MDADATPLMRACKGLAFALLFALSFSFRAGELRIEIGGVAGWLALFPFAAMIAGLRPWRAFVWATGFGTLGFCAVLFWLYVAVHEHGGAPAWIGVGAVLLMSFACALHQGLAASAVAALQPVAGRAALGVLPAAWVVSEHLRSFDIFSGFPWAYLGYAVHGDGPALALASVGGVYGLSFVLAGVGGLLQQRKWVAAAGCVAALHAIGFALGLAPVRESDLRVGVIQANIPQGQKWDRERVYEAFGQHVELSRLIAAANDLDLILWPETAVPILLEHDREAAETVAAVARDTSATLVLGGIGTRAPTADEPARFYNSAFAIGPDGEFSDRYDKSVLVPFGEYVPLRSVLGAVSALAVSQAGMSDMTAGAGARPLRGLPFDRDHAVAALICYEVIYPSVVRQSVQRGARILVNLTNDAWYGRTSAPHQFLAMAAMRSAEHGVPMLRAANTGISAIVDARGLVQEQTEIFERRALAAVVPGARAGSTLYTRFGDWVVWGSWTLLLALGGRHIVRSNVGGSGDSRRVEGSGPAVRGTPEASLTSTPSGTAS